jgi:hypothetical protein
MSEAPHSHAPAGTHASRASLTRGLLAALDGAILLYALATALFLAFGGLDLVVVSVRRFSKPALLLVVLVAVRAALPRHSWLSLRLRAAREQARVARARLEERSPWARAASASLVAVASVHVLTKGTSFLANLLFGPARPRPFPLPFAAERFAETFAAWDSGWYFDIAQRGYYWSATGQSSLAFFPLYPLLMRALAWPFGGSPRALWLSGIALAYLCLLLGLAVLHRFCEARLGGREPARRAVLYVAVFPFAYFFTQVYTESLFLLTSVAAVFAASSSRWAAAGLFGALATLTRPNGILIAVPLGLLALAGRPGPRELARRLAPLALVPVALACYCAFAWRLSGDPLGWLRAQATWGYSVGNRPWVELMRLVDGIERSGLYGYFFSDPLAPYYFLHGMVALAGIALVPSVFARLGPALGAYVAASLYVPLSGNALGGIGRYAATQFPLFMLVALLVRSPRVHEALLIGGSLLLAVLSALFATWHPVY